MYSIIVFSNNWELKDITVSPNKTYKITQQRSLVDLIEQILSDTKEDVFTEEDVEWMYDEIAVFADADEETKRRHIEQQQLAQAKNR